MNELSLGQILNSRYKVGPLIGQGGMGSVYKGTDLIEDRQVALKVLRTSIASSRPEDVIRFRREAEITARLNIAGVVKTYDTGVCGDGNYLVMEYVAGESLEKAILSIRDIKTILSVAARISSILSRIHEAGIVHRDIKPGNILLTQHPSGEIEPKITDFGLAQIAGLTFLQSQAGALGTFCYMSPEQAGMIRAPVDHRSDLYSIGIVLYQWLTCRLPFQADNLSQLLHSVAAVLPPPPGSLRPAVPAILDQIVCKLIAKDPDERYQSASALSRDLTRLSAGEEAFRLGDSDQTGRVVYRTKMVGRQESLQRLRGLFDEASRSSGSVCFLRGEPGSGKTRLASEFGEWAVRKGAISLEVTCMRLENRIPYQVVSDAFSSYLGRLENMTEGRRAELVAHLQEAAGTLGELLVRLNPLIRDVVGDTPPVVPLDPEKEQLRLIETCARVLCSFGDRGSPAVLLIDDLQWIDQGSLDVLFAVWSHLSSSSLLVVATYRDNETGPEHPLLKIINRARESGFPFHDLLVENLSKQETADLIGGLLRSADEWVAELAALVRRKSLGNPLLALEIVRQLVERRVICWDQGCWRYDSKSLETVSLPDAMLDAIMARIGALDRSLTDLLSTAALIGRSFKTHMLHDLCGNMDLEHIVALVDEAERLRLLDRNPNRPGELQFAHDRIRDAFAARLTDVQSRAIHNSIGALLEREPNPQPEHLYLMYRHFREAGDLERSLRYSLDAARAARSSFANESAIEYYEAHLELLDTTRQKGTARWRSVSEELVEVCSIVGRSDRAIATATELLSTAQTRIERARLHRFLGSNYSRRADYAEAERHFRRGLALMGKRMPGSRMATLLFAGIQLLTYQFRQLFAGLHKFPGSRELSPRQREVLALFQSASMLLVLSDYVKYFWVTLAQLNFAFGAGASKEYAAALTNYGFAFAGIPWRSRLLRHQDRALRLKEHIGDTPGIAESHRTFGFSHCVWADWDRAERSMLVAREMYAAVGDPYELTHVYNGLQSIYFHRTDLEKRYPALKEQLSISTRIGNAYGMGCAMSGLGGSFLVAGNLESAEHWVRRAVSLCLEKQQWLPLCTAYGVYAQVAAEMGDFETAVSSAYNARQVAREHSLIPTIVVMANVIIVEVLIAQHKSRLGMTQEKQKRASLERLGAEVRRMWRCTRRWPMWRGQARRLTAEYHLLCGRADAAERKFRHALRQLTDSARLYEIARCQMKYGELLQRRGRVEEATRMLGSARALFVQIGAKKLADQTGSLARLPAEHPGQHSAGMAARLASLLAVSRYISTIRPLDQLLKDILMKAVEVTGAQRGYLFITSSTGESELRVSHCAGAPGSYSKSIVTQVTSSGQPFLSIDASHCEQLSQVESVVRHDLKSVLCVPLIRREAVIGACYLDNSLSSGVFGTDEQDLLVALMAQAAISIENARAFDEINLRHRKLLDDRTEIQKRNTQLQKLVQLNASHVKSFGEARIVTQDPAMLSLIEQARRFADAQAPVLISGHSGCGKEVFAHLMHFSGPRSGGPFVKVNCSAIPETLFESEFFGYERGAFTGASSARKGKFELADKGTLFLDEVGELPLSQQAKLLRVLEEHEITPVGGSTSRKVDVRVVAATNRDLAASCAEGRFRQDLFFRLTVLTLRIPPLSERPDDIPVLAEYFLSHIANEEGGPGRHFDEPALHALRRLSFEGNVRQLRNLVHRLYVSVDGEVITAADVDANAAATGAPPEVPTPPDVPDNPPLCRPGDDVLFQKTMPYAEFKDLFERRYLTTQLGKHGLNLTKTAQALGLLPSALSRKLKSLGVKLTRSVSQ